MRRTCVFFFACSFSSKTSSVVVGGGSSIGTIDGWYDIPFKGWLYLSSVLEPEAVELVKIVFNVPGGALGAKLTTLARLRISASSFSVLRFFDILEDVKVYGGR